MTTAASTALRPAALAKGRNMIAVASGKGGVGKTWFAITLAHALAKAGRRTLLFDGDLGLTAGGTTAFLDVGAVEQTLPDGALVFFLGVIDPAASFGSASLDGFGGGGAFTYNVDDIVTAVPEPGTAGMLMAGQEQWRRC